MDKLLSQREVELTNLLAHAMDENGALRDQLADTMRENERLRSCLKAFYFDTMYKDSPGLHDIACGLLAPYDEEFAEVLEPPHWLFAHLFGEDGKPIPKPTSPLPADLPNSIEN